MAPAVMYTKYGLPSARFLSIKRYTGSSWGMVFSRQSMTRKSALRSSGGPLLEVLVLLDSWVPDWSAPGSTPAKAVMAFLWVNRVTSPSSAMSCGPRGIPPRHDNRICRELGCQDTHFGLEPFQRRRDSVQCINGLPYHGL